MASVLSLVARFEANFFSVQKTMLGTGASQRSTLSVLQGMGARLCEASTSRAQASHLSTWSVLQGHGGKALRGTRFLSLAAAFEASFFSVQKATLAVEPPGMGVRLCKASVSRAQAPNGLFPERGSCILNKHLSLTSKPKPTHLNPETLCHMESLQSFISTVMDFPHIHT